jgi:hypothetical protein
MKKMINTILIAAAIAAVGNVDARTRAISTKKDIVAEEITDASKNAVTTPTKETTAELMATLNPAHKTEEERELIVLKAQEDDTKNRIEFRTKEMASIDYGYFGFGLAKEIKDKYQKSKALRYKLEKDLKQIQANIYKLRQVIGEERSDALEYALTALKIIGISIVITGVDEYFFEGTGRKYIGTKAREAYEMMPNIPYIGREARAARAAALQTGKYTPALASLKDEETLSKKPFAEESAVQKKLREAEQTTAKARAINTERLEASKARRRISSARAAELKSPRK